MKKIILIVFLIIGFILFIQYDKDPVLQVQVSNKYKIESPACVISENLIELKKTGDHLFSFCQNVPKNSTCLYLKSHSKIYVRSNEDTDNCSDLKLEKKCFVVNFKNLTCTNI